MEKNQIKKAKICKKPFSHKWVCLTKWKENETCIKKIDSRCEYDITEDVIKVLQDNSVSLIELLINKAIEAKNPSAEDFLRNIYEDGIVMVLDKDDRLEDLEILPPKTREEQEGLEKSE